MGKKVSSFLQLADEEIGAARKLSESNPRQAIYFVSQAAEKIARAVCEAESIPVGITHNLGAIANLLPAGHPLKQSILALDVLSPASTRWRYPTAGGRLAPAPQEADLKDQIADVARLIDQAKGLLRRQPPASQAQAKALELLSPEQRKAALADKIFAVARARNLDIPDGAENALPIYADERALREMSKAIVGATSFKELLEDHGVSLPNCRNE